MSKTFYQWTETDSVGFPSFLLLISRVDWSQPWQALSKFSESEEANGTDQRVGPVRDQRWHLARKWQSNLQALALSPCSLLYLAWFRVVISSLGVLFRVHPPPRYHRWQPCLLDYAHPLQPLRHFRFGRSRSSGLHKGWQCFSVWRHDGSSRFTRSSNSKDKSL